MRGDLLILLADGIVILCLARLFLQAAGLSENHALLAFSKRSTDWLVNPLHKILPIKKYDPACLLSGLLLYYIVFTFITLVAQPTAFSAKIIIANFILAILNTIKSAAYVLLIGLFIRMALSIKDPYSQLSVALERIYRPILSPVQFLKYGRYDFSGSILALLLWIWLSSLSPQITRQINLWLLQ